MAEESHGDRDGSRREKQAGAADNVRINPPPPDLDVDVAASVVLVALAPVEDEKQPKQRKKTTAREECERGHDTEETRHPSSSQASPACSSRNTFAGRS